MTNVIRHGIIGCGNIGRTHANALVELDEVKLVAVCDIDVEKARAIADAHGVEHVFSSVEAMFAAVELDTVSVATDHKNHFAPSMFAIEHGVNVIVEKPITTSLDEAHQLVAAAKAKGVKLGGVFQRRFFPSAQRMHQAIEDGRLGRIIAAECIAHLGRDRSYFEHDDWRGTWKGEGGGVLMNMTIHMIDMLLWMVGKPTEVYGRWATLKHSEYIDVEDAATAVITFESGALATLQAVTTFENGLVKRIGGAPTPNAHTARIAPGFRLAVHGSLGDTVGMRESPEFMQATTDQWTFDGESNAVDEWYAVEAGHAGFPAFHSNQLQDFALAVLEDREPTVTGEDAYNALEVVKAVYLSESRRMPVKLPMSPADRVEADRVSSGGE
ncbi:Gfo/Idh/MocA family oxidoreductase [Rhodoglobus aureus]|uniref:Gfo/Idh/MocA family oxidoreductase n=2 Tax=Rhodoglobus aureus TaxID=191497 RepID=A0ABP4GBJ0_9MICO